MVLFLLLSWLSNKGIHGQAGKHEPTFSRRTLLDGGVTLNLQRFSGEFCCGSIAFTLLPWPYRDPCPGRRLSWLGVLGSWGSSGPFLSISNFTSPTPTTAYHVRPRWPGSILLLRGWGVYRRPIWWFNSQLCWLIHNKLEILGWSMVIIAMEHCKCEYMLMIMKRLWRVNNHSGYCCNYM